MMDKVNIIENLEELEWFLLREYEKAKDDIDTWYFRYHAVSDALAMLKEQEPKPPNLAQDADGIWATCGKCGHKLRAFLAMEMDTYIPKYCANCGKEVKWYG